MRVLCIHVVSCINHKRMPDVFVTKGTLHERLKHGSSGSGWEAQARWVVGRVVDPHHHLGLVFYEGV